MHGSNLCIEEGDDKVDINGVKSRGISAIRAPWRVGPRVGLVEVKGIKAATVLTFAKSKRWFQPVYFENLPTKVLRLRVRNLQLPDAGSIMQYHKSDPDSGSQHSGLPAAIRKGSAASMKSSMHPLRMQVGAGQ